jgi:hypothetical protein
MDERGPHKTHSFFRAFTKSRKATIIFVVCVDKHGRAAEATDNNILNKYGCKHTVMTGWLTGIAATELPLRVHLGLKLAGPLCAAI